MAPGAANVSTAINSTRTGRTGENAPSGNIQGDDTRLSHGPSFGQSFGSGTSTWHSGIWGNSPMSTGFGGANTEIGRPRDDQSHPTTAARSTYDGKYDGKAGSASLVASSESDGWSTRQTLPWNSTNTTSPSLSNALMNETGLLSTRQRNSNQNVSLRGTNDNPRSISPYYQVARPAVIGQRLNSKSPHKSYLDPTSGSFVTERRFNGKLGNQVGFQGFGGDGEDQAFASTLNNSLDQDGLGTFESNRLGFITNSDFPVTSSGTVSRNGSLPPSRNGTDQPFSHHVSSYNMPTHQSLTQPPFKDPLHRHTQSRLNPDFSSQPARRAYEDLTHQAQEAEVAGALSTLSLEGIVRQKSNNNFGDPSVSHFPSQESYNRSPHNLPGSMRGFAAKQALKRHGNGSLTPDSLSDGPFIDELQRNRGFVLGERGVISPGGSDYRQSQQSSYYSALGTPTTGINQYYNSSCGPQTNRGPPIGHSALLDRKLRGLQQEQQSLTNPQPNLYMNQHFRGPFTNPYDYPMHNEMAMNPLAPYYSLPPGIAPAVSMPPPKGPARDQDVGQSIRSALLEEFRSNNKTSRRYELKDIYNHMVEFSGDQHGSRFIQLKLETANSDEKDRIFREIQPNAMQLMTDVFGNYVIQKFFEHGNQSQKKILANVMKGRILSLSTQMYGCRVVQKALEHVLTDQQAAIVKELENHVLKCVKDQNGNHVIQKAIERVPAEHIQFINNAFIGQVHSLATHPYGCRVIQRMLEHCQEPSRSSLLQELHACGPSLIADQYGNYVTQHVIEHGRDEDRAKIINLVTLQVVGFSKHKFASNVVEKSIQFGTKEQRRRIMLTLTTSNEKGDSPLLALARDQYGNYVIQKLLLQLEGVDRENFWEHVQQQLALLKRFTYGKQITAIEKVMYSSAAPAINPLSVTPPISTMAVDTSAATTPPPLISDAQSPQSSSLPSTNTSTVDGPTNDGIKTAAIGPVDIAHAPTT